MCSYTIKRTNTIKAQIVTGKGSCSRQQRSQLGPPMDDPARLLSVLFIFVPQEISQPSQLNIKIRLLQSLCAVVMHCSCSAPSQKLSYNQIIFSTKTLLMQVFILWWLLQNKHLKKAKGSAFISFIRIVPFFTLWSNRKYLFLRHICVVVLYCKYW